MSRKKNPNRLAGGVSLSLLAGALLCQPVQAEVTLAAVFSDHMVLQAEAPVPVWGWAAPGEQVEVTIGSQTKTTVAGGDGKWMVRLDKMKPSADPSTMTVKGKNTLTIRDVLIGEVWLASGQSNMAYVMETMAHMDKSLAIDLAEADFPMIRMFVVTSPAAAEPQAQVEGVWVVCTPETVKRFSALAYHFGHALHQELKQPVGMIVAAQGSMSIQAFISLEAQERAPELKPMFENSAEVISKYDQDAERKNYERELAKRDEVARKAADEGKRIWGPPVPRIHPRQHMSYPANIFNGRISPLIPFAIRGVIYYQGEGNTGSFVNGKDYESLMALLIKDWRGRWGQGDFPFAWVQLPNYKCNAPGWVKVRESQLRALSVPNTGMAVTLELSNAEELHPPNKREVGRRLMLWALAKVYGRNIPYSGPMLAGYEIRGSEILLSFTSADGGLKTGYGELKGFTIFGADKKWWPARARIEGASVRVSAPEVKAPVAVRYGWADVTDANLVNGAGLPASPFRTDDFCGPLLAKHEIRGGEVVCSFTNTGGGLRGRLNKEAEAVVDSADGEVRGFRIAGADRKWLPAKARIDGDTVVVSAPAVKEPVAVSYLWGVYDQASLFNDLGEPALRFRTCDW